MQIADVETYVIGWEVPEPLGNSHAWFTRRASLLVRVLADDGTDGWGEAYGSPAAARAVVADVLGPMLAGRDPFNGDVLWEEMYTATRNWGRGGVALCALSAVDIALWDLRGKVLGLPVSKLLGGQFHQRLPVYGTCGFYRQADEAGQSRAVLADVAEFLDAGYRAVKVKAGGLPDRQERSLLREVRQALGPDRDFAVDANSGYNAHEAIRMGRYLEELDALWFEDPVGPDDRAGLIEVKETLDIPVAGGETESSPFGLRDLVLARAVDIVQPELTAGGGLTYGRRAAALVAAMGLPCFPHVWGSAVAQAAALQFTASLPPSPASLREDRVWFEVAWFRDPLRTEIVREPAVIAGGYVQVPTRPGLGIEIDWKGLEGLRLDR